MSIKSVLIIRCGALGDLVYATSVIEALRSEYGNNILIDFVCTPGSASLFNDDARVHKVFHLKHKKIPIIFSKDKKNIINYSKQNKYDLLINFESGKQFRSLVLAIEAKNKIGEHFNKESVPSSVTHVVDITKLIFKDIVSQNVFDSSFPKVLGSDKAITHKKYALNKKYIIISPSNSHQKKNRLNYRAWENESWKELINRLSQTTQVVIVGNKNEDDFFNKLKPYPENVVDLVAKTSLGDLIGVIDGAVALVATDTGTAHIASSLNTEVFALIGPTPADVTGPYQTPFNKVHIISLGLECSPCYKTKAMKNCKENVCMSGISAQMVYETIVSANVL